MTSWFNDISPTNGVISIVECGARGVDFPKDGDGRRARQSPYHQ